MRRRFVALAMVVVIVGLCSFFAVPAVHYVHETCYGSLGCAGCEGYESVSRLFVGVGYSANQRCNVP